MKNLPTLKQIQYFLALEKTGSFSKAADHCYVTQSTLSAAIQDLEQILELQLVDRSRRKIELTPEGQHLLSKFSNLVNYAESISHYAAQLSHPEGGVVRLGTIPTIAPYLLPSLLPALRTSMPQYTFQIQEDLTERLVEQLEMRQIDLAIIAFPYPTKGLETDVLYQEPFYLVGPEDELRDKKTISMEETREYPLLMMEDGHCLRDHAMQACQIIGKRSEQSIKINSLSTLVQLVAQGYGYCLLPEMCVKSSLLQNLPLKAVALNSNSSNRGIGIIWRSGSISSSALKDIKNVLKNNTQ